MMYKSRQLMKEELLKKIAAMNQIALVGMGMSGQKLFTELLENYPAISFYLFDNLKAGQKTVNGYEITEPRLIREPCDYVITVERDDVRKALMVQLESMGVEKDRIIKFFPGACYEYHSQMEPQYYKDEISEMYYAKFGKRMDWEQPKTYNEIINWEKINIRDRMRSKLADKYLVKEWVADKIGEKYITPLYGVWEHAEEIDFEHLPEQFVLKMNNASERNVIVKDKVSVDRKEICKRFKQWVEEKFGYLTLELHYTEIPPKIICEKYIAELENNPFDYKIYCFHGRPEFIQCIRGEHTPEATAAVYDCNWNRQKFNHGYIDADEDVPRPECLELLLNLTKKLCKDFRHVRVDWNVFPDGRILFGEMSFSSWAGLVPFTPDNDKYDLMMGKLILGVGKQQSNGF